MRKIGKSDCEQWPMSDLLVRSLKGYNCHGICIVCIHPFFSSCNISAQKQLEIISNISKSESTLVGKIIPFTLSYY